VAVLPDAPPFFGTDARTYYASLEAKEANAFRHRAAAVIHLRDADDPLWSQRVGFSRHPAFDLRSDPLRRDGVVMLTAAASASLLRAAGLSLPDVIEAVKAGPEDRMVLPLKATLQARSRRAARDSQNVIARLVGRSRPAEHVVYVAHLDHLGIGEPVDGDAIYNGAVDNASGVAALLAIGRAFARSPRPARSVVFVASTAEEPGMLGAEYFIRHWPDASRIVTAINMDGATLMLFPLRDVVAMGAADSTLGDIVAEEGHRLKIAVNRAALYPGGSDHWPFVQRGIPSLWVIAGHATGNPALDGDKLSDQWMRSRYHSPRDDMSQPLDFEAAASFARLNFLIGLDVANGRDRPHWYAHDFFGQYFSR
jgi:hypothetical protein